MAKKTGKNKRVVTYAAAAVILIAVLLLAANVSMPRNSTIASNFSRETNPGYYGLLPPKPANFDQMDTMFRTGIVRDNPEIINESYWKQPEWFPRYADSFLPTLDKIKNEQSIVIWSLGVYESQLYRVINSDWLQNPTELTSATNGIVELKGDNVVVKHRFWIRSAPGASQRFGVGLKVVYPNSTLMKEGFISNHTESVTQDPETTMKYINASIEGQTEFTLGPYFPNINPDYVKQNWIDVEISKDIPKGTYVVGVDAGAPSKDYQEQQSFKYGLTYTDPNIGMFRGPSEFRLFIQVV